MKFEIHVWAKKLCPGMAAKVIHVTKLIMRRFRTDEIQLVQGASKKPLCPITV